MTTSQAESHLEGCPRGDGNSRRQTCGGRLAASHDPIRPSASDKAVFRKPGHGGTASPSAYRLPCRSISVVVSRRRRRRHSPMRAARPAVDDHGCLSTSQQFLW